MLKFSFAAHVFMFLHTFPLMWTSLTSILKGVVKFSQITFKFLNKIVYHFQEIQWNFAEFSLVSVWCNYELNLHGLYENFWE